MFNNEAPTWPVKEILGVLVEKRVHTQFPYIFSQRAYLDLSTSLEEGMSDQTSCPCASGVLDCKSVLRLITYVLCHLRTFRQ